MDSQSKRTDREAFDRTSEHAKEPNYLLPLACNGNREALNDLFASSSAHLYQAAFRILSNPHDAEDAVQDGLLSAFRNLHQFRGHASFSTWLHRIAINSSLMRLRKRKVRSEFPLEAAITDENLIAPGLKPRSDDPNPEEHCVRVEQRKILSEALLQLSSPFRAVIELCDLEGLPAKEAAQKLGISLSTMKSRLFRSRRALKTTVLRGRSSRPAVPAVSYNSRRHRPELWAKEMESIPAA